MYIFTVAVTLTQAQKDSSLIRFSQSLTIAGNLPGKEDAKPTLLGEPFFHGRILCLMNMTENLLGNITSDFAASITAQGRAPQLQDSGRAVFSIQP